jgi:hypothetical protein
MTPADSSRATSALQHRHRNPTTDSAHDINTMKQRFSSLDVKVCRMFRLLAQC